jgi:hypothetical protein
MHLQFHPLSRSVLGLLGLATVVHLLLGFALGLSCDEAHYALYARHLDLSYFDHPPLVGWIQWPLVAMGQSSDPTGWVAAGVLRIIPAALWLVTACLVHDIAQMFKASARTGFWAVCTFALAPVLHMLGLGLLPDTLLMFWTAAVMWWTLKMTLNRGESGWLGWSEWLVLGCLLGWAGLSKYTAIFLALPVVLCLLHSLGWRLLLQPQPWGALLLAVLWISPVVVWNAQNDWASFAYQLHHGRGSEKQWGQWAGFAMAQLILYPMGVLALLYGVLHRKALGSATVSPPLNWTYTGFFGVPMLALAYLAGGGTSLPHWTAPAWVAWAPYAGMLLADMTARSRAWRWSMGAATVLQLGLTLAVWAGLWLGGPPWMVSPDPKVTKVQEPINPFADFYGWDTAGQRAAHWAGEFQVSSLAVQNWTLASRLAWYAQPFKVHVLAPGFDQFSIWSGPLPKSADAVVLDWSQMAHAVPVGPGQFEHCVQLEQIAVMRAGRAVSHFSFYHCQNWGGQSSPRRKEEP